MKPELDYDSMCLIRDGVIKVAESVLPPNPDSVHPGDVVAALVSAAFNIARKHGIRDSSVIDMAETWPRHHPIRETK